jgi:hypothetical protein
MMTLNDKKMTQDYIELLEKFKDDFQEFANMKMKEIDDIICEQEKVLKDIKNL